MENCKFFLETVKWLKHKNKDLFTVSVCVDDCDVANR